jgi:dihydroneopterin aldolase
LTDLISLSGLRARGRHGVYPAERENGQDFVVDVRLEVDLAPAARTDDVADTVHYGELAGALVAVVGGEPVNLIETLAGRLLDEFGDVAVTLHRRRPEGAR